MIITKPGKDLITITETDVEKGSVGPDQKIHLIRLKFEEPTEEKINWVLNTYKSTNRYIISDNIPIYNRVFKNSFKKYYVENSTNNGIFSFFKKNNKVLLNFNNLDDHIKSFILRNDVFKDVIKNLEIMQINEDILSDKRKILNKWHGNVIVS